MYFKLSLKSSILATTGNSVVYYLYMYMAQEHIDERTVKWMQIADVFVGEEKGRLGRGCKQLAKLHAALNLALSDGAPAATARTLPCSTSNL